jgi:FSR family fosmidomycin resistance protein-like MFS transporter
LSTDREAILPVGPPAPSAAPPVMAGPALRVLAALTVCHLINDLLQALLPALYPLLKSGFALEFWQIGLITFTNQVTSSLLQPVVGMYMDRSPQPTALPIGMAFTLTGVALLALAPSYGLLLAGAALLGVGSSIFHPESSRIARIASGGRHGFAQSLFQTGGNFGTSLGPLLAALIVVPRGRGSLVWFVPLAIVGLLLLARIGRWYWRSRSGALAARSASSGPRALSPARVRGLIALLLALVFSKYVYVSSFVSYFMFFLIDRFGVSVQQAQLHLFAYLGAVAAGTFVGGPLGDRFGRKPVILGSILGILPFAVALPYLSLFWTTLVSIVIGLILSSAFSAIIVYAQELVPHRVGMVSGLFFGFAFGVAGLGAAGLGWGADAFGIQTVFRWCAWLPALGLIALWLPDVASGRKAAAPG